MTFGPFSQEGSGVGWEVGENFKGKKLCAQTDLTTVAARYSRLLPRRSIAVALSPSESSGILGKMTVREVFEAGKNLPESEKSQPELPGFGSPAEGTGGLLYRTA
jgi:hypothetical protein